MAHPGQPYDPTNDPGAPSEDEPPAGPTPPGSAPAGSTPDGSTPDGSVPAESGLSAHQPPPALHPPTASEPPPSPPSAGHPPTASEPPATIPPAYHPPAATEPPTATPPAYQPPAATEPPTTMPPAFPPSAGEAIPETPPGYGPPDAGEADHETPPAYRTPPPYGPAAASDPTHETPPAYPPPTPPAPDGWSATPGPYGDQDAYGQSAGDGFGVAPPPPPPPPGGSAAPVPPYGGRSGGPQNVLIGAGEERNRLGLYSVIFGVVAVLWDCCLGAVTRSNGSVFLNLLFVLAAIVLGYMHTQRVKTGHATNVNLARVGIGLGVVALVFTLCFGFTKSADYYYDHVPFNSMSSEVERPTTQ